MVRAQRSKENRTHFNKEKKKLEETINKKNLQLSELEKNKREIKKEISFQDNILKGNNEYLDNLTLELILKYEKK